MEDTKSTPTMTWEELEDCGVSVNFVVLFRSITGNESSIGGTFVLWNFRPLELSFPRVKWSVLAVDRRSSTSEQKIRNY